MSDNLHKKILVSDNMFVVFGSFIMTYITYVTVKYYDQKQLDEHGNPYSASVKIWIIISNLFMSHIYAAYPVVVVIHNLWNTDINLTLLSCCFCSLLAFS